MPLKEGGFAEGVIDSTEGDKVTVKIALTSGPDKEEKRILKKDQVQQVKTSGATQDLWLWGPGFDSPWREKYQFLPPKEGSRLK